MDTSLAPDTRRPTPRSVVMLAAAAECDPRTARRALVAGLDVIRGSHVRHRLAQAARSLGLTLPLSPPNRAA